MSDGPQHDPGETQPVQPAGSTQPMPSPWQQPSEPQREPNGEYSVQPPAPQPPAPPHYPPGQYPSTPRAPYAGTPYPGSQYPGAQYQGGQYPGAQYPGSQYPGSQYPGSQYPGSQYPGSQYPYPVQGRGPGRYSMYEPAADSPRGQAIGALVVNIALLLPTCFLGLPSIVGLILAAVAIGTSESDPQQARTLLKWSWGLAITTVALGLLFLIGVVALGSASSS